MPSDEQTNALGLTASTNGHHFERAFLVSRA